MILCSTVLAQTAPSSPASQETDPRSVPILGPWDVTAPNHDPAFLPPPEATTPAEQPTRPQQPLDDPFASMGGYGGGFGGVGGFGPGGGYGILASYRTTWIPDQAVVGQPTNLGEVRQDLSLRAPVYRDECDLVAVTASLRWLIFDTHAILPNSMQPFPSDLWDVRFGANYSHKFDNGWIAGGGVNFGSASDRPFASYGELTAGVNGFLRIPQGEHNAWLFTLAYSPTGELNFPIPGVAFQWMPSDNLRINIGLPFQVTYRPIEDVTLDASYVPIQTVHARATWRVLKPLRLYGAFDWSGESYFLYDRPVYQDRFFSYEKRLSAGARYEFAPGVSVDLSSGYLFDRFYFQGQHYSDNQYDRVDVKDGEFLALKFEVRY
jgi:hypothetical protein